ncbi:hypothetical protein BGZ93_000157 [Podila epicladia]|nr:hypothetical protein BGZ92_000809 [Podila epicladia]KAG0086379.1 hypothetical protein BGZ93_000157 [Podila epicladia]
MTAYQEQALREHEAAELGAASGSQFYMFHYTPPPGALIHMGSTYSPHGHRRSTHHTPALYALPTGSHMAMAPPSQVHVYPPMANTTATTTIDQSQQNIATLGSAYFPTQDGADAGDLPSVPPPPYTPQVPK